MEILGWIAAMIILIVIEVMTTGLTTVWFAGGAFAAFLLSMAGAPFALQVGVFVGVSVLLMLFTRPVAVRYLNSRTHKTNIDGLPGQTAVVKETIDNLNAAGKVMLNGMEWTARSVDGEVIEAGAQVIVREISGVKLMVVRK